MCGTPSVGGSSSPAPPEPETVKRVEAEVVQARNNAKNAAASQYGLSRTNVTKGALVNETAETKKKKLGGE